MLSLKVTSLKVPTYTSLNLSQKITYNSHKKKMVNFFKNVNAANLDASSFFNNEPEKLFSIKSFVSGIHD